jgi:hypothetical protein
MLDPWIIEEILKKEQEQRRDEERGHAELPVPRPYRDERPSVTPPKSSDEGERGVVIIDI